MVKLFIWTLILMSLNMSLCLAADVEIEVQPKKPAVGEVFRLIFRVKTKGDKPFISFDRSHAEVIDIEREEISSRAVLIRGRFVTERTFVRVYRLSSNKQGVLRIRDIRVDVDGQVEDVKGLQIQIVSASRRKRNIFVEPIPTKYKIYKGEGINASYYLYSKYNVVNYEIKTYPKFNGFIKRFHRVDDRWQAVEYNGEVFKRSNKYSARLYPEKTGTLLLDPLKLNVQYQNTGRTQGPFGGFFGNMGPVRQLIAPTEKVEVEVIPLPSEGVPADFSGLVGKHNFKIAINKNKFLVNEAIEIKLVVEGPGALENFSGPVLISHENLEHFDTKSTFEEINVEQARKTFEMTFLGRGPLQIPGGPIHFSYFDPDKKSYESLSVNLPNINVIASSSSSVSPTTNQLSTNSNTASNNKSSTPSGSLGPVAPDFDNYQLQPFNLNPVKFFNWFLIFVILVIVGLIVKDGLEGGTWPIELNSVFKTFKKGNLHYSNLNKLLRYLDEKDSEPSLHGVIHQSHLTDAAKSYFQQLVDISEKRGYDQEKNIRFQYNDKFFKEVRSIIKKNVDREYNEDHHRPV